MARSAFILCFGLAALTLGACSGDEERVFGEPAEPTVSLTQTIDDVESDFPCPPFVGVLTDEASVFGDADGDGLSEVQSRHGVFLADAN